MAALPVLAVCPTWAQAAEPWQARFAQLETTLGGRLGVFALDTATGRQLAYRAQERFAFCSTFKLLLASAILKRSEQDRDLLQQRLRYSQSEVVNYSPVSEKHVGDGMTVADLCAAALQYSDNTAANVLIKHVGGLAAVNDFAHGNGAPSFRLDRWETALNSAIPGDLRDTVAPQDMARALRHLAVGDGLARAQRVQLCEWLKGNTTGATRIRAGVPAGWGVGDKTGSGDYGSANDLAVIWPPGRAPLVLAVYTTRHDKQGEYRSDVIAAAAAIVVQWLG
ncbi:MAG: class A beta-lactamase [Pseudomonas sp.]|nr:class A beta-lactamase [Pseudomonas sp. PIA16]MDE1165324.1 class A beta-lactamase [Pseudomonas sp.]